MKIKKKFLIFAAFFATCAHAEVPIIFTEQKTCQQNNCFVIHAAMPLYRDEYLRQYAWNSMFGDGNSTAPISKENLDRIAKNYVDNFYAGNFGKLAQHWSAAQESGSLVQVRWEIDQQVDSELTNAVNYYVFDRKTQKMRSDPFAAGGKSKIVPLLKEAYVHWQMDVNALDHASASRIVPDEMPVSDNWYIAKNMIVFSYRNDGQIAPVADGIIELPVPIDALHGIIQPDILQAAQNWPVKYEVLYN